MSADRLAEALQGMLKAYPSAESVWQTDAAISAHKALAAHESDRALAALTAEQSRLGMYEAEKQEPDRLDATAIDELAAFTRIVFGEGAADFNSGVDEMAAELKRHLERIDAAKEAKP